MAAQSEQPGQSARRKSERVTGQSSAQAVPATALPAPRCQNQNTSPSWSHKNFHKQGWKRNETT